ncbi:heterokaryon incompatibility protein-domain-containing protein [Neurospora crassa]|nr:heterokaryon incompatibility protein-domain-containing protein [Neurospora crassa]
MADPTDLGLTSPDPKNGPNHAPCPHLCSACSQIDFKALFTSHERPSYEYLSDLGKCKCSEIFHARQKHGWPGPKSTNGSDPPCCFCKFYNECQIRSRDIASRSENVFRPNSSYKLLLEKFHSLAGFPIKHRGCEDGNCRQHSVQDVCALQFVVRRMRPRVWCGYDSRLFHAADNAILRVVDGPKFPGLTRKRAAGGGLLARRIIPHQVNYNVIGEWLSLCHSDHIHCDGDGDDADVVTIPGFQVIDCTTTKIVSAVDLLAGGGEPGRVEYVTLSYVWGQAGEAGFHGPVLREDAVTLPDDLPLVISDAVEVVKRLGYRYLWIDRYCIPQNDSPVKHLQIRKMDRIYSCSVLTIIAAAGDGPEYGLPGVSSGHRTEQLSVQVTEEISLLFYKTPRDLVAASKWNTRGWTYQEGVLSKRRLVFTDEMVYFQCYEMHGDEVLSLPLSGKFSPSSGHDQGDQFDDVGHISFEDVTTDFGCIFPPRITSWSNPDTAWDRIQQFMQRQLTFEEDTLDAISGIFERYLSFNASKAREDKILFLCGLPVITFSHGRQPTTTSMQELLAGPHLSQYIPDSTEFAALDTYAELICRLVDSLLWFDDWKSQEFKSMAVPTDRERHLRRSGFPSWTWAGWKRCRIDVPRRLFLQRVFDSCTCITVHVEYEDEAGLLQRLNWVKDNERIHNLSLRESRFPIYLVIKGTVMDMKLTWHNETGDSYSKLGGGYWIVTSPSFFEREKLLAPRCLFDDIELKGEDNRASTYLTRNEVNVLGIALEINPSVRLYYMTVMILRPVTRLLDGKPETMYERSHLHSFCVRYDHDVLPHTFRQTVVRLC